MRGIRGPHRLVLRCSYIKSFSQDRTLLYFYSAGLVKSRSRSHRTLDILVGIQYIALDKISVPTPKNIIIIDLMFILTVKILITQSYSIFNNYLPLLIDNWQNLFHLCGCWYSRAGHKL